MVGLLIGGLLLLVFFFLFQFSSYDWKDIEDNKKQEDVSRQKKIDDEKLKKGTAFEVQISELISEKLKGAVVINNCILNKKSKDGKDIYMDGTVASKEFDVICLSKKGVFVIEAKNYSGAFISGNFHDKTWLTSYSKNKVFPVYSPYKQVTEAIMTLKRYFPDVSFKKYVVFPDSTKISDNLKKSGEVLNLTQLRYKLNEMTDSKDYISKETIRLMKDVLVEENERARQMNAEKEHLEYVKKCRDATAATA